MGYEPFRAIRDVFFDRWRERHPEEASTLGIDEARGRLADPSLTAIEDEAAGLRETLRALDALSDDALGREERLDRWAIRSWSLHEVRRVETGAHLANVELGLLPYHLLRHFLVHAREERDLVCARGRVAAIPGVLDAHQRTLATGIDLGAQAHAGTVRWIAERTIPNISRAMRELPGEHPGLDDDACAAAAFAYDAHARFLRDRVLPCARESGSIGLDETVFRLRHTMGLERSPEALVAEAREVLARAHEEMRGCASALGIEGASDIAAIRAALIAMHARPLASSTPAMIAAYEALLVDATSFGRAHGLVHLPDPLSVSVREMPAAIAEAGYAQNWAAPLTSAEPRAHFLVAPDPAMHPAIAAPLLTVHEGVPGHSLQSLAFARARGRDPRPVRFLAVADDVAMARSSFGAMVSIEGWATWVEHRMLELGFYEGERALYAWSVRALRAVRVIADLSIHTGALSNEACVAMLVTEACVPEATAKREVARYQRIPLQALTYLTGALAIEEHLAPARARGEEPAAITQLLAEGPIPPTLLGA